MSLDFHIEGEPTMKPCSHCDGTGSVDATEELFETNITHNLAGMADAAGIYDCVWRPEDHGITTARQCIEPLRAGLARLRADPDKFRQHDAANGWGTYEHFVP
jgi:hypothetical protein